MSFRWRLMIGVMAAVLLTAGLYGLVGYVAFKRSVDASTRKSLEAFQQAVLSSLELKTSRPRLLPNDAAKAVFDTYSNSRFRVLQGERVVLNGRGIFPEQDSREWQFATVQISDTYNLELALNVAEDNQSLAFYVRIALFALPAALALAIVLAFILQGVLLRPVRELTKATQLLSQQAMPEPVKVPPGHDELSQLAESFNRMTESLQSFLERERSFTRYASHELRTPLSNLRVLIEGMQKGIVPSERAYIQLGDTMNRMESILSGLLALTRSAVVHLELVMLDNVLQAVLTELPGELRARVQVKSAATPLVLGRDDLIKGVLDNLVRNALYYSSGDVNIYLEERTECVEVCIRDYGVGVPPDLLNKLTEPFFRMDKRKGGLGLGLALVKHVTTSLKGSMQIRNAEPGLEVVVRFLRARGIAETTVTESQTLLYATKERAHA
ncbi:MAG: sensor histidine kinase [Trueperaceae bacterium]